MNIMVFTKQVPDTETKIKIADDGKSIVEDGVNFILSPYDEFAIEEAIKTKENLGGEVTVVTLGPKRAEAALRTALAMGCDRALHLEDESFLNGDSFSTSKALAGVIKKENPDLIFFGKQAVGTDNTQVGQMTAEMAGIGHGGTIVNLEILGDSLQGTREIEGGSETIEIKLPAIITAQRGLNEPRYPALRGIMKAKKQPIEKILPSDLNLTIDEVGTSGAKTKVISLELPPARKVGRKIEVEADIAAKEIVNFLKNEAKVL